MFRNIERDQIPDITLLRISVFGKIQFRYLSDACVVVDDALIVQLSINQVKRVGCESAIAGQALSFILSVPLASLLPI